MYNEHQPLIERYAKQRADNFFKVIQFVLLTIQQPLYRAVKDMDVVDEHGLNAPCLWGNKLTGWVHAKEHMSEIYEYAMLLHDAHPNPDHAASALLGYLADLPGLGLVKAGFVMQLAFGLAGCIDTHNIKRYNVKPSSVKSSAFKNARIPKTRQAKVNTYLDLCAKAGGVASMWDTWCEYVATQTMFKHIYDDADHVSSLHCKAFGLTV